MGLAIDAGPCLDGGLAYNPVIGRRGLWRRFGSTCPLPVSFSTFVAFVSLLSCFLPIAAGQDSFESLLRQGFDLHQQRRFSEAIAPLERAHRLRPGDYFANLLLGIDYLRTGQAAKALSFLETAGQTRPMDATALGYLAEAHAASGRVDLAIGALQLAIQRDPSPQWRSALVRLYLARFRTISEELRLTRTGLARSYRLRAQAMRERKDPRERNILLRAYSLSRDLEGIESDLAHAEIRQQRFDLARQFLTLARERNPKDLDMIAAEAYMAAHTKDWEVVATRLRELGQRSRHRAQAALDEWPEALELPDHLRHALAAAASSTLAETATSADVQQLFASQSWEAVATSVSTDANSPEELFWLGVSLARLKRFGLAVAPLERARSESRFRGETDYWLALSYARLAEEETAALSQDESAGSILHAVRGEILLRLAGDGVAAAEEYKTAVASAPDDPALWAGLAAAESLAGDWDSARESALRALELDPNRTLALRTLAEVCMQERDYAAAIPALEKVLRIEPTDIGAQFLLGTACSQTGDHERALAFLKAAERQGFPDEKGRLQYLLGTVLRKLGRTREAQAAFQRSQELADTFAETAHELAKPSADSAKN